MEESMERFNGTYAVNLGMQRLIATRDPGFIEYVLKTHHKNYHKSPIVTNYLTPFVGKGLLTSNGDYWLKQRRLIQPGFHADRIKALYTIIKKTADQYITSWKADGRVDAYPIMNQLAFEITINTLFNVQVPPQDREALSTAITENQSFIVKDVRQPYKSWWFSLSGERKRNMVISHRARQAIHTIVQQRKSSGTKCNDLLDMLLDARYEDTGSPMTDVQLVDELLILLIAGHETAADALSWMLYLLGAHPHEQEKLRQATHNLTPDECVRHERLLAVIKETMRLYPPAWIADRVPLQDDTYHNFTYSKGTVILLFFYGLHRHEGYWKDATSFIPDRFLNDQPDKGKIFFPFGAGPRLCIGNNFAMAEMAIVIQTLLQQFTWTAEGTAPKILPLLTLRPDHVLLHMRKI
jgi:cytochrome P450